MKQQVETDSPLMRKLIREYIPQANEHCQNQFVRYYELLIDYNNRMNLPQLPIRSELFSVILPTVSSAKS